jgi:hypothetical protein
MQITSLHIGQRVHHPQYGTGLVKALNEHTADIQFDDGRRTVEPAGSGLLPAEPTATLTALQVPLDQLLRDTVATTVRALGLEPPDQIVTSLAARWHGGRLVLQPADSTLQSKEIPIEMLFHKIVMIRNQLRLLEQKVNAHTTLTEAEKIDLQQYITRCYGSLTTFNLLFKDKEDAF